MPGSAPPRDSHLGTTRDPAHQLLLGQMRRRRLRDGGEMERLRAAIAILRQEAARMRGEWSPDDVSEWDQHDAGSPREPTTEPTPAALAALAARAREPLFRHPDKPFGNARPSRPRFTEDDARPGLDPQFHQVKLSEAAPTPRVPAGLVLLDEPTESRPTAERQHAERCVGVWRLNTAIVLAALASGKMGRHASARLPMATLDRAIQIAAAAHAGQVDKEHLPYILHPLRLMMSLPGLPEKMAAVLHDVVEDTSVTHADLEQEGFPADVLEAVRLLTHAKGETRYVDYVVRIKPDPVARAVKLADLTDNTRIDRHILRPDRFDHDMRRIGKYLVTYKFLTDQIDEPTYRELMKDLE